MQSMFTHATGRGLWLAASLMLACLTCLPAQAQQRFELDAGEWQAEPIPDPTTAEGQLQRIRKLLAQNDPEQAQQWAEQWLKTYPNHSQQPEARLLLGDAKVAQGNYYKSLFDYEIIARQYPSSPQFNVALQREYDIAVLFTRWPKRVWRKFLGMRIIPAMDEGVELFIRIQERVPGTRLGERASLSLADYYYVEGEMFMASEAYDLFLLNYPDSKNREWAMLRLIQANLARFKGPQFDSTGLIEAMERLQLYRQEFPAAAEQIDADGILTRITNSLAEKEFQTARWYEKRGEPISADYLYRRLVQEYPQTNAAEKAVARLVALQDETSLNLEPDLAPRDTTAELEEMDRQETSVDDMGVGQAEQQESGVLDPSLDRSEAEMQAEQRTENEEDEAKSIGSDMENVILQDETEDNMDPESGDSDLEDPAIDPVLQDNP